MAQINKIESFLTHLTGTAERYFHSMSVEAEHWGKTLGKYGRILGKSAGKIGGEFAATAINIELPFLSPIIGTALPPVASVAGGFIGREIGNHVGADLIGAPRGFIKEAKKDIPVIKEKAASHLAHHGFFSAKAKALPTTAKQGLAAKLEQPQPALTKPKGYKAFRPGA